MTKLSRAPTGLAIAVVAAAAVLAQDSIRKERVSFAAGATSATVKGMIKGDQTVDYLLGAAVGQTMSVSMKTSNASSYFNVLPPGSPGEAIFIGSTSGNEFTGTLAATGDYTVRVYLMRNAARRNESANYTISFKITSGPAGKAPASDARVASTPYHATGKIPCSIGTDPKRSAQCGFGVIRGARGNAEVHVTSPGSDVTSPDAKKRVVIFADGKAVSSPDPGARLTSRKQGDEWTISINDHEFYVIPEAVIVGG